RAADMRRARLNERTRIAREIHDNVGHTLTRAIMMTQADQIVATTIGDDGHAAQFARIGATLDEAMTMIRRSVHDLKDEGTDFQGMMEDAAAVSEGSPLRVRLVDGIRQAPSSLAHCFAAIIREALTNTVRHGTAREATVRLIDLPGLWQLVVQDDGGKPERPVRRAGGIGLADIEERARALGGTATCGPYAQGWRVFVSVPKTDAAAGEETLAAASPAAAPTGTARMTERTEE
ncbi:Signal transduction histidine kinase, partial [Bifidobacterium italicum]